MRCRGDNGDCPNPARRRGLCWAHVWREQHGSSATGPIKTIGLTPAQRLKECAINYADADSDDDLAWKRASDLLFKAAEEYVREKRARRRSESENPPKRPESRGGGQRPSNRKAARFRR